ncbi:MAG TPA: MBL fold metallo-hydrolase [Candidatus Paenibacillus intestinavium]|nr:MBL fold metallo-hydrolase [Candidatus Paenibacillus intestinavium]
MEIILMGTACAASGIDRDNTYLLLREFESGTLIDVGGNPLGKLKSLAIPTNHIKRLLFTHFHNDHIYGLPSLLWGMWIDGRTEPFDIYCVEERREWLENWLDLMELNEWPCLFEIRIHSFNWKEPSLIWSSNDCSLSIFPASHGDVPTVGVEAIYHNKVVIYSADTILNPTITRYEKIDLLIHEATTARNAMPTHSSLEDIVGFYNMDAIEKLVLVHLMDDEPYEEVLNQLPAGTLSKITMGQDLLSISLQ